MSSTTKRKKKASKKALPSYPAPSLPELLIQYDDWVDAARLYDWNLMYQLYHRLKRETIALITSDLADLLVVELQHAGSLVRQMAEELARRAGEFMDSNIHPCPKLRFNDRQVIDRLALRIARIRQIMEINSTTKGLSQPPVAKKILHKALDYTDARKFEKDHPNKLKKLSAKKWHAKLDEFTSDEAKKIVTAIDASAAGKK